MPAIGPIKRKELVQYFRKLEYRRPLRLIYYEAC